MAIDLSSMDYAQTTLAAISKPVSQSGGKAQEFPLDAIDEDPDQPRKEFDKTKLEDLAASIKESGVLQPITIKPHPTDPGRYLIRYGARRYRASILAGRATIPAFIAEEGDDYAQVIENLQRDDLTPLELAEFIQKRLDAGDSKVDIAKRLGKRKEFVTFHLALVDPPPSSKHSSPKVRRATSSACTSFATCTRNTRKPSKPGARGRLKSVRKPLTNWPANSAARARPLQAHRKHHKVIPRRRRQPLRPRVATAARRPPAALGRHSRRQSQSRSSATRELNACRWKRQQNSLPWSKHAD